MMRWAVNLYTTPKTKILLPVIMQKVRKRKYQPDIWLITLSSNEQNLLDFFYAGYYIQPMFMKMNPDIVGIAESEEAARQLVVKITEDVYRENGNFNMRSYFRFKE